MNTAETNPDTNTEGTSPQQTEAGTAPAAAPQATPEASPAEFENLQEDHAPPAAQAPAAGTEGNGEALNDVNLDVILDVSVTLSMELGRARVPIRNLLQLNQGSVVELERAAGEALDVYVNGTLIAQGEVVVVNDRFGVRLTDVVSPAERIRRLK